MSGGWPLGGSEPPLLLDRVTAGYGGEAILREVDVSLGRGEVVGLVGPNASGKTTLVRVASRALRPMSGRVLVHGRDPYRLSAREAARLVAVVPQEHVPVFPFTVLEVVAMGRTAHRGRFGRRSDEWVRVRAAMHMAGVEHLAERNVQELSGGERQRVVLAQALAQDAAVLLLDEPTTHLDVRHVLDILRIVRRLATQDGKAVLAIFHDLNLASAASDRIYVLADGRVVADGTPDRVVTGRMLREVYGVEAEVTKDRGRRPVVTLGGIAPSP